MGSVGVMPVTSRLTLFSTPPTPRSRRRTGAHGRARVMVSDFWISFRFQTFAFGNDFFWIWMIFFLPNYWLVIWVKSHAVFYLSRNGLFFRIFGAFWLIGAFRIFRIFRVFRVLGIRPANWLIVPRKIVVCVGFCDVWVYYEIVVRFGLVFCIFFVLFGWFTRVLWILSVLGQV